MKLSGKNIVLTGGTTGIGKEMVKRLHKDNQLLVMASNQTRLDALAAEYPKIKTHCVDLGSVAEVDAAANAATSAFSKIDALINNAAIQFTPTFTDDDFDVNSIEREVAINFTAICRLTAHLLPALKASKESTVLNVNSGLALAPKPPLLCIARVKPHSKISHARCDINSKAPQFQYSKLFYHWSKHQ